LWEKDSRRREEKSAFLRAFAIRYVRRLFNLPVQSMNNLK